MFWWAFVHDAPVQVDQVPGELAELPRAQAQGDRHDEERGPGAGTGSNLMNQAWQKARSRSGTEQRHGTAEALLSEERGRAVEGRKC
jgi:hypothetical protein